MRAKKKLGSLASIALVASATFLITSNMYGDLTHPTLVTAEILLLILLHLLRHLRLWISRELLFGVAFLGYAFLSLAWTENLRAALVTMPAIENCTLILILFTGLSAFHNLKALLAGVALGFACAAVGYTLTQGFPFRVPEEFSYNTIASMYLFGLLTTLMWGAYTGRRIVPLVAGVILLVLIAATTSIKTNLGTALGIIGATILYFRFSMASVVRATLVLAVLGVGLVYTIQANPDFSDRLEQGFDRVSLGLSVLVNRENDTGSTGLGTREGWKREGLKGWAASPVFGHGVEAFRADFGITSHSTPIDLLYNSGIIGAGLFYGMFASIVWRLLRARNAVVRSVRARVTMGVIAYLFISLSGIIYYDPFVAMFIGIVSGFLMRTENSPITDTSALIASPVPSRIVLPRA